MSMQQALTVVGTVVGAYFGYPQLGFVVGSLVGAALTPDQKVEGPRIDDQKVTVSTEGAGIPTLWGTGRLGGNVIESTDKMEVGTTERQGKGGGGVKSTTYKYYVNMRTLLCQARDGQEADIRKIWQDGKLVYDTSSGISVGSALATMENARASLILYQGTEDQLPDPTEEARYGIGNVPAYRGIVSVVLNQVECPGGRVPQFSFELGFGASAETQRDQLAEGDLVLSANQTYSGLCGSDDFVFYRNHNYSQPLPYVVYPEVGGAGYVQAVAPRSTGALIQPTQPIPIQGGELAYLYLAFPNTAAYTDQYATIYRVDARTGAETTIGNYQIVVSTIFTFKWAAFDPITGGYVLVPAAIEPQSSMYFIGGNGGSPSFKPGAAFTPTCYYNGVVSCLSEDGKTLTRFDTATSVTTVTTTPVPTLISGPQALIREDESGVFLLAVNSIGDGGVWKWQASTGFKLLSDDLGPRDGIKYGHFYADDLHAILGPNALPGDRYDFTFVRFGAITLAPTDVASIISEECELAGLNAGQYDVSTISKQVHGYTITNPASARAGMQPLMTALAIDATEEDGKLKFFNRADKTSIGLVPYDDLGCVEDGAEPGDPMPLTRANVTELARSVTVSYINRDFDYQTSTEEARRQITGATADQNVELAISMDSDQAATAAHLILYDAHNERNRRSFKLSRKYAVYSPGDVLTFEYPRGSLSDWRLVQLTDTGALVEGEVVPANASLYAQTAAGGTGYQGQEVTPLSPPTRLQLLDIPILRDVDNNAGIYAAMDGFGPGWNGGELFVGDDDSTLEARGTVSDDAPIGFAETVLAPWDRNAVDEFSVVTVNIGDDIFSNVTRDVLLAGGGEFWALGAPGRWEIGASAIGSSLGGGRYTLTRHLRGLFGTEQYTAGHQQNDIFVLLRAPGMLRPTMGVGDIGQSKKYRAVSKGRSLDSTASQSYANTGEGLRPLAPINLRRTQSGNDITLRWDRRSRLAMNNVTGVVPLGEASERYTIEFYTSGAYTVLAGVLSSTGPAVTITSAQQTAFGLTPGAAVYARVMQVSDSVGNGAALQGSGDGRVSHLYWRVLCVGSPTSGAFEIGELTLRTATGGASAATGGTAIASSSFSISYPPSNAFDGNPSSLWVAAPANSWVGYQFANKTSIVEYALQNTNNPVPMPKDWLFQWSDDGAVWTTADARSGITWTTAAQTFAF